MSEGCCGSAKGCGLIKALSGCARPCPAPTTSTLPHSMERLDFIFFADAQGRVVGRNIFLDSNTFRHSLSVPKKRASSPIFRPAFRWYGRRRSGSMSASCAAPRNFAASGRLTRSARWPLPSTCKARRPTPGYIEPERDSPMHLPGIWRKLHLSVGSDTGQIIAAELTSNGLNDGSQVGPLLEQIAGPVASFTGDGASHRDDIYREVCQRHPEAARSRPVRAPRQRPPTKRDRHLQLIAERGRIGWQRTSGYNWQALVYGGYRPLQAHAGAIRLRQPLQGEAGHDPGRAFMPPSQMAAPTRHLSSLLGFWS